MKRVLGVVAIIVVAVLLAGAALAAFAGRLSTPESIPVALVNLDEPVTVGDGDDERTVAAGRQLAATITTLEEDSPLAWTLVDGESVDGDDYYAVVTIPESFSQSISDLTAGEPVDIDIDIGVVVETRDPASPIAARIARTVTDAAVEEFNDDLTAGYLDNIFISFTSIDEALAETVGGTVELHASSEDLASGAEQLADGAGGTAAAAGDLATGAASLADGAGQTAAGADALAGSLGTAAGSSETLTGATGDAATGSAALAATLQALAAGCPPGAGPAYCAQLATAAADAVAVAKSAGIADAVAGQTATGLDAAASSADALDDGSSSVADAADQLADGAAALSSGADDVASGADELASGASALADGAGELASGLAELEEAVPSYGDEDERKSLADAIAAPVASEEEFVAVTGARAFAVLAAGLALWLVIGALYLRRAAVPGWAIAAGAGRVRAVVLGFLPRLVVGLFAACGLWLVLMTASGWHAPGASLLVLVAATASATAVLQAVYAIAGRIGHLVAGLLLVLQVTVTGLLVPIETALPVLQTLGQVLPLSAAMRSLQALVYAEGTSVAGVTVLLVLWTVAGIAVAALATRVSTIPGRPTT